jgi:non-ribosomal peptide synthetase component F
VIYTLGSTGKPKGVMIPHLGLVNYLHWGVRAYGVSQGTGSLVHSCLSFDLTITGLLAPWLVGQRVVLLPEAEGVETLAAALQAGEGYSLVKLTPAHLTLLSQLIPAAEAPGRVQTLVIGGEALMEEALAF